MRKSINERIPQSEAKMLAIFDFRVLKHMVAKARIAQESAAGVHLRGEQDDFEDSEDVIFDQGLVTKSLRSHALTFQYVDFQSEGQEISVNELVKRLVKEFNRLQRIAALRSIIDIYAIADVVLVADDEVNKVGRRLVKIIGCFSADSVIAERGFSQLAHIRTKLRNRLKSKNLNASMSLRLNPLTSLESVLTRWRSEKERRKKVVRPQQERKLYAMETDIDRIVDQFDSDYSECSCSSESDEDTDDVSKTDRQEAAAELESLCLDIGNETAEPESKRRRL